MNPTIFGRGSWYIFFQIIFFFIKNSIKKKNYIFIIKNKENSYEKRKECLDKFEELYHNFILNNDVNILINKINEKDVENLKQKLNLLISGLPCNDCREHSYINIHKNKIFETNSLYYILHFFIELRNVFYDNKIDRNLYNNEENILKNEKQLFETIIKN